ncbi:MAG: hypothetical protein R3Y24_00180 [Eubacteriales bacterium]
MFDYKKHTKRMIFFISALLSSAFTIWIFSLYFVFFEKPLFIPADYKADGQIKVKEFNIQQRVEGVKSIIIISGSNALFSMYSPVLEEKTGYKVYNLSVSSMLPLCLYIYFAEKYAQNGDIIISPLEYPFYTEKDKLTPSAYACFSTWAMQYTSVLPLKWQKELSRRNILTYWQRLPNFFKQIPITKAEVIVPRAMNSSLLATEDSQINRYGEILEDKKPTKSNFDSYYFEKKPASEHFKEEITAFRDKLAAKGVSLYVTFPVSEKQSRFNTDMSETQEKLQYYRKQIEQCGINFFGTDSFYNFENKYFFNSVYHLNATGAILRSLLLAEDINTYVLGKESSYDLSSPESRKSFFKQQEQEALRIIKKLREEQK